MISARIRRVRRRLEAAHGRRRSGSAPSPPRIALRHRAPAPVPADTDRPPAARRAGARAPRTARREDAVAAGASRPRSGPVGPRVQADASNSTAASPPTPSSTRPGSRAWTRSGRACHDRPGPADTRPARSCTATPRPARALRRACAWPTSCRRTLTVRPCTAAPPARTPAAAERGAWPTGCTLDRQTGSRYRGAQLVRHAGSLRDLPSTAVGESYRPGASWVRRRTGRPPSMPPYRIRPRCAS